MTQCLSPLRPPSSNQREGNVRNGLLGSRGFFESAGIKVNSGRGKKKEALFSRASDNPIRLPCHLGRGQFQSHAQAAMVLFSDEERRALGLGSVASNGARITVQ